MRLGARAATPGQQRMLKLRRPQYHEGRLCLKVLNLSFVSGMMSEEKTKGQKEAMKKWANYNNKPLALLDDYWLLYIQRHRRTPHLLTQQST